MVVSSDSEESDGTVTLNEDSDDDDEEVVKPVRQLREKAQKKAYRFSDSEDEETEVNGKDDTNDDDFNDDTVDDTIDDDFTIDI